MSCSIWSTRIIELRMMMPDSAIVPSIATKPNGLSNTSSADGDADQAERRGQHDHQRAREALQLEHQQRQHDEDQQRHAGGDRLLALRRILDRAADFDAVAERQRARGRRRAAARSRWSTSGPCASPLTSARTVIVGRRSRRQMMPSSRPYSMSAICESGTALPPRVGIARSLRKLIRARSSRRRAASLRSACRARGSW